MRACVCVQMCVLVCLCVVGWSSNAPKRACHIPQVRTFPTQETTPYLALTAWQRMDGCDVMSAAFSRTPTPTPMATEPPRVR